MTNPDILLTISADQVRRHWGDFARKAYVEPVHVRDGFHDYALMALDDYKNLFDEVTAARAALKMVRWEDGDHGSAMITQAEFDRRVREGHRVPTKA